MRVRSRSVRTLLAASCVLLPGGLRRFVHVRLLGHDLHPTASIGRSVVDVDHLVMGEGARIGHLVLVRGCEEVRLGAGAVIAMLVWVNSVRADKGYFTGQPRRPALVMGEKSLITVMHFIDACDLVELADYAAIAGFGSIVQTHAVDIERMRQATAPIRIGDHSLVASRVLLLPGAVVPDRAVVAAGAVVGRALEGHHLFAGVPAKPVRDLDPEQAFFVRETSQLW
ncbi:carbonic anhydrase/acetyltransferase-like protein (isoleucine patch superfamily) [Geodermatophilus normandii]|uniref:Carbonic anhydrase/acetyltransferase-like protein (Isoleucine patch superfamily) n=1 Tax=Geodermatophilus normandii TaxID=1137989 RepID=A0A317QJS7_9ACTN|nr:hypothetical protein [Geodermatophilus normandii]PWW21890.1 carbonic anhydrase/acetyltransferase-like protein (isoleucine patch superfamily) [Geodermatophilus normandii]